MGDACRNRAKITTIMLGNRIVSNIKDRLSMAGKNKNIRYKLILSIEEVLENSVRIILGDQARVKSGV